MYGAFYATAPHLWEGKRCFQVFLMLGSRHERFYFYLSLVARSSRVYCDGSGLIVIKYTEI